MRRLRAVRCGAVPHTCIGQCAASHRRPTSRALRRFPPTPGSGPRVLGSLDGTLGRSPELRGAASPPLRCRRPRDDSPPNRLQRAFITPLHPLHPLVCGKIFTGLSCASKVTSVGSMPLVSWLGSFRAGRYGGWRWLPPSKSLIFVSLCITLYHNVIHG